MCGVLCGPILQETCHGGVAETVSNSPLKCSLARYCPAALKGSRNQAQIAHPARLLRWPQRRRGCSSALWRQIFRPLSDFWRAFRTPPRASVHTRTHTAHSSLAPSWMRRRSRAISPDGLTKSAAPAWQLV